MNNSWFECKVRFDKTLESGIIKKVTEAYMVDALSFTEAERRFIEEMTPYISGEFLVTDIKRSRIGEVCESIDANADKWYKAKIAFVELDETSGQEKRTNHFMLVQGTDLKNAIQGVEKAMEGSMADWLIVSIAETPIMDIFKYKKVEN